MSRPQSMLTESFGPRVMINMRWPKGVVGRIDLAAALATVRESKRVTRTEWALRVLIAALDAEGVHGGIDLEEPAPALEPKVMPEGVPSSGECPHPKDARMNLGYMTRCGVCGERMDK